MNNYIKYIKTFDQYLKESESYNDYPEAARKAAQQAIEWKEKYGDQVKAGTAVGWKRAHQLANRQKISLDTIKRMKAFFDRHQAHKDLSPEFKDEPWRDHGYVAWLLWGGDAAREWAEAKLKELEQNESEDLSESILKDRQQINLKFKRSVLRTLDLIQNLIQNNQWLKAKQEIELLLKVLQDLE